MRFLRRYGWLFVLLLLALGVYFYQRGTWQVKLSAQIFPDSPQAVEAVQLARLGDTLYLQRQAEVWRLSEDRYADTVRVNMLLDLLAAIHLDMPLGAQDSATKALSATDSVISVEIRHTGGKRIAYRMAYLDENYLYFSLGEGKDFRASTPGFYPRAIRHLALCSRAWANAALGVERPSDIAIVELRWQGDSAASFRLEVDSGFSARLLPCSPVGGSSILPAEGAIPYDTARVASFLQSLTELSYDADRDTVPASRVQDIAQRSPFLEMKILAKRQIEGQEELQTYRFFRFPTSAGHSNFAYLQTSADWSKLRIIRLAHWDATMVSRRTLSRQ